MEKTSKHTPTFYTFTKKIIAILTLCIGCLPTLSGQARMVKDIRPGPGTTQPWVPYGKGSVAISNTLYFTAYHPVYGVELWKTDGTDAGTVLVKDINEGYLSSNPSNMTNVNGTLFFTIQNDNGNNEGLWKSDGTAAGTVLVKSISIAHFFLNDEKLLFEVNGIIIFWANDDPGSAGAKLWRSDGTPGGTQVLKELRFDNNIPNFPNFYIPSFAKVGNTLFFKATDAANGVELWKTDGTTAGTVRVTDLVPGIGNSNPNNLTNVNGTLFFTASGVSNGTSVYGLWKSDGTANGTVLVKAFNINISNLEPGPLNLTNVNGTLFFQIKKGNNNLELWKSNGTESGTVLVKKDIDVGDFFIEPPGMVSANGTVFFTANTSANGFELWRSDGTEAGTIMVRDINPGPTSSTFYLHHAIGSSLVFQSNDGINGDELWISDGTPAGTRLIRNIGPGAAGAGLFVLDRAGNTVFMFANDGTGEALWKTNGTAAGTVMVKDINTDGASSEVSNIFPYKGNAYFSAADTFIGNQTLWRSDGTEAGTAMFNEPRGGLSFSGGLTAFKELLFFNARNASNGSFAELWRSDGTTAGTRVFRSGTGEPISNVEHFTTVGGNLFFSGTGELGDRGLWKTDGTAAGTVLVRNIAPINRPDAANRPLSYDGKLIFTSNDGSGTELWRSDGSTNGTVILRDINRGALSSNPVHFTIMNNILYFFANDGINGQELWKTDGTFTGTVLVKDINPGPNGFDALQMIAIGNTLYMSGISTTGIELWKSDGTSNGTVLVRDIWPGNQSSSPQDLTNLNGTLLFRAATPELGTELWRSDGTTSGTMPVRDINPGRNGGMSLPGASAEFTQMGNLIYFKADNGTNGTELWQTDGTTAGTRMVQDISPGSSPSLIGPSYFRNVDGALYFTATDGIHGLELWRFAPSSSTAETFTQTLKIFPNPVQDRIFIEKPSEVEGQLMVRIFDITGQLVQTATYVATPVLEVKTDALRPGVYVVELNNAVGARLGVQKMIKLEP